MKSVQNFNQKNYVNHQYDVLQLTEIDLNPQFVHIQTLIKGDVWVCIHIINLIIFLDCVITYIYYKN
jgi:hypothetical protein